MVGWLVERGWNGHRPALVFAAMLLASAICLAMGVTWLAGFIGLDKAVTAGALPFLLGDTLKSALAAVVLTLMARKGKA